MRNQLNKTKRESRVKEKIKDKNKRLRERLDKLETSRKLTNFLAQGKYLQ